MQETKEILRCKQGSHQGIQKLSKLVCTVAQVFSWNTCSFCILCLKLCTSGRTVAHFTQNLYEDLTPDKEEPPVSIINTSSWTTLELLVPTSITWFFCKDLTAPTLAGVHARCKHNTELSYHGSSPQWSSQRPRGLQVVERSQQTVHACSSM
jgi:hypothetical protein